MTLRRRGCVSGCVFSRVTHEVDVATSCVKRLCWTARAPQTVPRTVAGTSKQPLPRAVARAGTSLVSIDFGQITSPECADMTNDSDTLFVSKFLITHGAFFAVNTILPIPTVRKAARVSCASNRGFMTEPRGGLRGLSHRSVQGRAVRLGGQAGLCRQPRQPGASALRASLDERDRCLRLRLIYRVFVLRTKNKQVQS
eukprot:COSAG04_NODE_2214_length_4517_cov_2.251019_2_plen_198_part_00